MLLVKNEKVVFFTIVYDKLWAAMAERGISQYRLIKDYGISSGQLDRLRKNESVSTHTIGIFCRILGCQVGDIMEYIPEEEPETPPRQKG